MAIIGLSLFAIFPWHIMKSRWALESNLFPDMVLIALYIIITSLKKRKINWYYVGIAVLSLSVYSHDAAYIFVPVFLIAMLIYLLKSKIISTKNAIISGVIALAILMPMILSIIINTLDLKEIKFGIFTIPRIYADRYENRISLNGNFIKAALKNLKIILLQNDGLIYNSLPFFGTIYIISLPFTILGLITSIKNKKWEIKLLHIWFIASSLLYFVMLDATINGLNICIIPLLIYTILGIHYITDKNKKLILPIISVYIIVFAMFLSKYTKTISEDETPFIIGIKDSIEYISNLNVSDIYIENTFDEIYIYTLFYTKTDVKEYVDTVKYDSENVAFEKVREFGKYHFYIPSSMKEDAAYLVNSDYYYDRLNFKETDFGKYKVLEHR